MGALTLGDAYTNADGYDCYPALAYVNGNALLYYTNFTPSAEYAAANSVGSIMHANNAIMRGTGTETVKITLPTTATFTINAPKGADVSVYDQLKNYNTIRIDWSTTQEQADGTVDYIFNIAKKNTMSYRVSMEGKRTQVGFFSNAFGPAINVEDRIVVDFGDGSPTEQDSSGKYSGESSLLLNLNERNKLNLAVGESYKVRGYRAAWQIVNDVSANIMIEPDFHYTVLSGEDVIDITPTTGGNAKDNWAWVTAKKPGVAIVEVTYDALDRTIKDSKTLYGASDPNRTGVFVVTVGDQYGDIGGMKWDAEYNEVYFTQEQGSLSITPMGENVTVAVASVLNGRMSGWTTVAGSNGTFEVPVQSGNNVLRITANGVTDYRVVRGSKVTPVITIEGVEGRTEVYPGDTIKIGLKGIYQPMAKFSGIYNPGFPSNMSLGYKLDETDVRSGTTQYGLIEQQVTVEVPSDAQGSITLTNGKITGDSLGSNWGAHRVLTDIGVGANFNASRLDLESLSLPDLTIAVARLSDDEYKAEAKKVVSDAFANYDESKYTAENWQKIIAAKDAGLAAIDAAETMSAVTEAKNTALTAMAKVARISSGSSGSSGTDKTHTKSYYKTTGLDFDLTGEEIDGYVTISFEDYGKRLNDADFETPLGVLIEPTQVPYEKGDSIAKVTVRLLDALDIGYTYTGTVENAFYLATLENFKLSDGTVVDSFGEFDSGAGSGWMITLNNWFINRSTADFDVEDGDYIKWQNTCQIGADIGCDWNNPSAEIIGLKFGTSGTLSPAFDTSVTHYIYTVSASTKFVKLEAELENYWSILTCTSEGVSYKPMQEIPVENGTVIYLESAFAEYAGDPASDTDKVTITIQLRGSAAVSTPTDANEEDQKAADSVIALIDEIGTVTKDSGEKIDAARTAYNKLTDAQKELVSNYSKLTAAEKEFAKLTSRLPFTDVEGHWALEAIEYAYVNDLMSGTSATVFAPDATLNRAMLATILYRLEGKPAVQTKNTYTDVAAGTWYTDAVIWASENGIVTGYGNGKFGPTDNITREQMAVMLYRYAAYKNYDVTNASDLQGFIDMQSISAWALNAIKWANAEKLINGRTAQTIVPGGNATRAEAAAILMRFRENIAK